jgi:sugar/nucleoside kinase (ribokinase family)
LATIESSYNYSIMNTSPDIIACGHLCLDLYPDMPTTPPSALTAFGKLFEIGALSISTGGSVSNTGLALHRLGANVKLLATVGDDLLGQVIISFLKERDPALTEYVRVQPHQASSYTVVLSPEYRDRVLLHCTGTNDTFTAMDVDVTLVRPAKIFHLGYPTLLPRLITDDGTELTDLYRKVKAAGVVTSLDTALPDPNKFSGQVNWQKILANALPYVDVFIPSIEEILFMLRRRDYDAWGGEVYAHLNRAYLHDLATDILEMGAVITGFKLGAYGMILMTADRGYERLKRLPIAPYLWRSVEVWHPAFKVNVVGTTGAGDSAYAGFLVSLLKGLSPQKALQMACAVGSSNVEAADSTSGIRTWDETVKRLQAGWQTESSRLEGF